MFSVHRSHHNPILKPNHHHPWEALGAFNWCPVVHDNTTYALYRAMSQPDLLANGPRFSVSTVGVTSIDEAERATLTKPLINPEKEWERFGCEDPRVVHIDGVYVIFYTALSLYPFEAKGIRIAVALSDDLQTVTERHLATPFNAKAMSIFPEKVNGKYVGILTVHPDLPPSAIGIIEFDSIEQIWDQDHWNRWYSKYQQHTLEVPMGADEHIEIGAPPVKTKEGWLLVYSHIQNYFTDDGKIFGIGALLLDLDNPQKIIGRTKYPFIVPETAEEKFGQIKNVTFPSGALTDGEHLDIYYGAADTYGSKASIKLQPLLDHLLDKHNKYSFVRTQDTPVLSPLAESPWESRLVFNPGALEIDGTIYIVYRAHGDDNTSVFGLATSKDGVTIDYRHPHPIYEPRADFEQKIAGGAGYSGCEDPRVMIVENRIYIAYTAYDGVNPPRVAMSGIDIDKFVKHQWDWDQPHLVSPAGIDDKDACLFSEKIDGKYLFVHRIKSHICADTFDTLDFSKEQANQCLPIIGPRKGMWDSLKVGIAGPPHKIAEGWLLFYHGVSEDHLYQIGALLLSGDDPTQIIGRSAAPILSPKLDWELLGEVNNVVFPCGSVIRNDTIFMYYGGADEKIGIATMSLSALVDSLKR